MLERTIKNNKASIEIYSDTVIKKYFDSSRNVKEYNLMKQIESVFNPITKNGWTYEFVNVLEGSEKGGIRMKKAKGISMSEDEDFNEESYYHAGVWLGYFHSLSIKDKQVKSFYDFTISNLFICRENQVITGLDPGSNALKNKSYYYDILTFLLSAIISSLKRKTFYNSECTESFIKGYRVLSQFSYDETAYNKEVKVFLKSLKSNPGKRDRNGRLKIYAGYVVIWFYLNWHLKRVMKKY